MSKILGFTMEEKQMLGIVKKNSLMDTADNTNSSSTSGAVPNKGISDRLINFLLDSDDDEW